MMINSLDSDGGDVGGDDDDGGGDVDDDAGGDGGQGFLRDRQPAPETANYCPRHFLPLFHSDHHHGVLEDQDDDGTGFLSF